MTKGQIQAAADIDVSKYVRTEEGKCSSASAGSRLTGFIAGANWALEQQQWISVEDAWPNPLQRVIFVVDAPEIYEHGKVYGGTYTGEPDSPYLRARNSFSTPGMGYPASHWMPAPEPPKDTNP